LAKPRILRKLPPGVTALLVGAVLFAGVYLLPPDTSLQLVEESGVLRVCVPASRPPLVTGNAENPGFDISVLQEIAKRLNLRLAINVNSAMGRDFNPRNWRLTRAQCEIVAGGVLTSATTRSFLETISTGIASGWVLIAHDASKISQGEAIEVYPGFSGLDRVALSSYLRGLGARVSLSTSPDALADALTSGQVDAAVTGSLDAEQIIEADPNFTMTWLPASLGRYDFGFGLWKGDLTLKRKILEIYEQLDREGFIAAQRERYGLVAEAPPDADQPAQ
jgi:polar amino acid transport system substrate-binding protein/cystine transport system substrate-binding protein/membrane-bound lytic murein transglycosylase F